MSRLYLASRSPRRRELLTQINVDFEVLLFRAGARADADVAEDVLPGEDAETYVQRVALAKAQGGVVRVEKRGLAPRPVLSADTTIDVDGEIIGKPDNDEHGMAILRRLSGRSHRVLTALAMSDGERVLTCLNVNHVRFTQLSDDDIRRYLLSGEHRDKAGAYGIQGRAALFIEEIQGSYTGIMGLPLFETGQLLRQFGLGV